MRYGPAAHWSRVAHALPWALPAMLMLALWLPGITQGWFHVDAPVYGALGLHAWRTGDPVHLRFGDQPYFNKPPLAIVINGLALHALGPHIWAARIPGLVAAIATLAATAHLARTLLGRRAALAAALVLATTPEFFRATRTISLDLWLALAFTAALACAARARLAPRPTPWLLACGGALGLALLVKPLLALIPLAMIPLWFALNGDRRPLARTPLAALAALALALPWHLEMARAFPHEWANEYFFAQARDRITTNAHGSEPWWYYLDILARNYWPWLAALLAMGVAALRRQTLVGARPAALLAALWCGGWFLLLSLSTDKAGRYLIPVYPVAAVAIAGFLTATAARPARRAALAFAAFAPPLLLAPALALAPNRALPFAERRNPDRAALFDFLDARPRTPLLVPLGSERLASELYLHRAAWPRFTAPATPPPPGALLVTRVDSQRPTADAPTLFRNDTFRVQTAPDPR